MPSLPKEISVVFLDRGSIAAHIQIPAFRFPHVLTTYEHTERENILSRIGDAEIVITNKVPLHRATLKHAGNLKIIGVAATGTDVVDCVAAEELGIRVLNVRGYAANSVPEHVMALMLALRRSINAYHSSVARGRWTSSRNFCFHDYPIRDLAGSTLGIFGRGTLGQAVGRLGQAFGMHVVFAARQDAERIPAGYTAFEDVLSQSDVISLHCPLTPATRGLLGRAQFAKMARKPLIINTARGALISELDLARALELGHVSGAALDVLTMEPPAEGNPLLALTDRPNVLITPHVAWASDEAMRTLVAQLFANIESAMGIDGASR